MDPLILARIQFAANVSFHILFPSITIALGWILLFFRLRFATTGEHKWMEAYHFWVKVFALSFGLGVVSGLTMSFQFGTNWPGFMNHVGNIAGPLLAYEVMTAFFLEAVFLGVMLFGAGRVPAWAHVAATLLVAIGTTSSAFWILALNSWMQTPAGFEMRDGVAHATDWGAILFNPSMPYRVTHMLLASVMTASFLVAGVSAYRMLIGDRSEAVKSALRTGLVLAAIVIPVQMKVGDSHGLNTLKHQPQKIAAMEANWQTGPDKPLILFAWPDEELRRNLWEISIPHGASLILTHSWDGVVPGLDDYVAPDGEILHPPVAVPFFAFRVMVGMGVLMLLTSWAGAWYLWRRGASHLPRPLLQATALMTFSGWIATLAGWYVTEVGRQPWIVDGVLKTADVAASHGSGMMLGSLIAYLSVYLLLLGAYLHVVFHLARSGTRVSRPAAPPLPAE
ncbi:cytochrome ubiquinol oxidase subunit I [Neotabrizicola shimadae]|uniref:Cytochrome ubiquinol oxidase subunit I n=1 Tax=Neotabrizicola shimadae TaxID=2807096 RepID=A0A8G1EES3_9RHOB|nr:cytochrome ubiquinol oxidase subunit I [Neotabrizicola shimadae]QYZ71009.1 cytochrome ubiquinol oxidase subunit I [Neotabrizicola shimadae]